MIVLTTNDVEEINQAMLRPGRLDSIVNVTAPDPGAVVRLIALYSRGQLRDGEDLTQVGEKLAGQIPAVIRECVERAKLHALRLTEPGEPIKLTAQSLIGAADEMAFALELLKPKVEDSRSERVKAAEITANALAKIIPENSHNSRIKEAVTASH
jgi:transitional endoplasmic reticulum ATPase